MSRVSKFVSNVKKEYDEFQDARAWANQEEMSYKVTRDSKREKPIGAVESARGKSVEANKEERSALGQLLGAMLQGRRYNEEKPKGTQAGHHVTDSKNNTKPVKK